MAMLLMVAACAESTSPTTTSAGPGQTTTTGAGPGTTAAPSEPTSVVVGWQRAPSTLDIGRAAGSEDVVTLENVYDSLTRRGRDGTAEPRLLTSWEYNEDATQVTLHLRQGVLFHNGDEMTAEDVAYSLNRLIDPEYPGEFFRTDHQRISDIEIIDDYTLLVSFSAPAPLWVHISPTRTPIIPAGYAEELGYDGFAMSPETAIGTGPYKVKEFVLDDRIVLEAFEDYWDGKPAIDEVIVRGIPDRSARVAALLSGDVDVIHAIAADQLDVIERADGLEVRMVPSIARTWITFNAHARPGSPLEDVRVREAMALAVDLQSIVDNLLGGLGELLPVVATPAEFGFSDDIEPYGFDPDRARELLDDAGYGNGIDGLAFLVRDLTPNAENVAQALQAMWADVGINVDITVADGATFTGRHEQKDLDVSLWVYRAGTSFHAGHAMRDMYGCESAHAFWSRQIVIQEVCDLLDEAYTLELGDQAAAFELYADAQRVLHENFANGGIIGQPNIFGVRSDLVWTPHPNDDNWMFAASWGN